MSCCHWTQVHFVEKVLHPSVAFLHCIVVQKVCWTIKLFLAFFCIKDSCQLLMDQIKPKVYFSKFKMKFFSRELKLTYEHVNDFIYKWTQHLKWNSLRRSWVQITLNQEHFILFWLKLYKLNISNIEKSDQYQTGLKNHPGISVALIYLTQAWKALNFLTKFMLRLNPMRLASQVVEADLALYLGSKLKLEQEEGLKGEITNVSFLPYNK